MVSPSSLRTLGSLTMYRDPSTLSAVPTGHVRCTTHGIQPIRKTHDGRECCRVCRRAEVRKTCTTCGQEVFGACTECPGRINLVRTPSRLDGIMGAVRGFLTWAFTGLWCAGFAAVLLVAYLLFKLPFILAAAEVEAMGHPVHALLIIGGPTAVVLLLIVGGWLAYQASEWLAKD